MFRGYLHSSSDNDPDSCHQVLFNHFFVEFVHASVCYDTASVHDSETVRYFSDEWQFLFDQQYTDRTLTAQNVDYISDFLNDIRLYSFSGLIEY